MAAEAGFDDQLLAVIGLVELEKKYALDMNEHAIAWEAQERVGGWLPRKDHKHW